MRKYIAAAMVADWVEPYKRNGGKIPFVIKSNHPRFTEGTRFDWGFVQTAIREGYLVIIDPDWKNEERP